MNPIFACTVLFHFQIPILTYLGGDVFVDGALCQNFQSRVEDKETDQSRQRAVAQDCSKIATQKGAREGRF